jgi:uncharacterized membrane protein YbjE (DUF340 family)
MLYNLINPKFNTTPMQHTPHLKQIQTIYWVIFVALIFMFGISIFVLAKFGSVWDFSINDRETFKSVIVILALFGMPAGYAFHKKRMSHLPADLPLEEKLRVFKTSFFIKIVTLEALAITALTGYLFSADVVFLFIFGLLFIAYLLNIPTRLGVLSELESNKENDPL